MAYLRKKHNPIVDLEGLDDVVANIAPGEDDDECEANEDVLKD